MTKLNGKTALITGGGTGVGRGIALAMAAEGCRVAVAGRRAESLDEVVAACETQPPIVAHVVDVSDRQSVAELFAWATELGQIDILVNSAGVNIPRRAMADLTEEDWDRVLQINATGAYNCSRAVLPEMRRRGDGVIVNINSIAGIRCGLLGGIAYNASKHAMTALGRTLAVEEKDNGIRVTNIYPGEVETPILDNRPVPVDAEHRARILQPEDIAAAVVMICQLPPRANVPELVIKPTTQVYT